MVVRKILEETLTAGSSSVIFTDADIPNSLIRVFSSNADIIPISRTLSGTSLTVTYEPQTSNLDVAVEIVKAGLDIVDDLTSTDTDKALSANQGKVLKDAIDTTDGNLSRLADTVPYNIVDLNDVILTSPEAGQILSINSDGNIVNINAPSNSIVYSTSEQLVGTWIDNTNLYKKTYIVESIASGTVYIDTIQNISIKLYDGVFRFRGTGNTLSLFSRDYDSTYKAVLNGAGTDTTGLYLDCSIGTGRAGNINAEVTIYYTKTS